MTIADVQQQADAIRRGEYEHFATDERVNYHTAVALLARQVFSIAWQPGYKEEARRIVEKLQCEREPSDL